MDWIPRHDQPSHQPGEVHPEPTDRSDADAPTCPWKKSRLPRADVMSARLSLKPALRVCLRRGLGAVAVAVALGSAIWLVVIRDDAESGSSPSSGDGDQGDQIVTAEVEKRVLESLQVTRGTVIAPSRVTARAPQAGEENLAVVVTELPHDESAEIVAGTVVVELNGRPVIGLPGEIPLFRDIHPGQTGPDVEAVQAALEAMGVAIPSDESGVFGRQTQAAIELLYKDRGYEPSSTLESEDAVDQAIADAANALDTAEAALQQARNEGVPDVSSLEEAVKSAQQEYNDVLDSEGVILPAQEILAVPELPAVLVDLPVSDGQTVQPGDAVASVGSSEFRVRIDLTPAQVSELVPDVEISVRSDRGYEATCTPGEARPAQTSGGGETEGPAGTDESGGASPGTGSQEPSGSPEAYEMTVACDPRPPADALGQNLRVTMTVQRSEGAVLVVPVTAVTTTSDGGTYVEVVGEEAQPTRVDVTVGGEADGFVAVEPSTDDALAEGMKVRVRRS